MEESFWPKLEAESVKTPLAILKEQGEKLQEMTKGVLLYEIKKTGHSSLHKKNLIINDFYIVAPLLDNVKYLLFSIEYQSTSIFPLHFININSFDTKDMIKIDDWASFKQTLKIILSDKKTKRILENLLAHSKEASTT